VQPQQAFLYANGSMTPLPLPPGTLTGTSSVATGINSSGQAVGYLAFKTGVTDAFLYAGGIMKDLGTLGGTAAVANGINNSGQIAGTYSGQANQAFLDTNGSVSSLGGSNSSATGINNRGEVVGYYTTSSDYFHAFLYDGTKTSDLGTLGGTDSNYFADGINDSGQVVGYSTIGSTSEAFLYTDDTMMNLNSLIPTGLGWNLEVAAAINKNGQIVGWGFNANGQEHGFLLTPSASVVPEPSALVSLLGLSIAGMIGLWRRKRWAA